MMPRTRRYLRCRTLACLAFGLAAAAALADTDPRAWTELDIVPMPKAIRLTGRDLVLMPNAVTLVLGARPERQSEIGADWINRRLAETGGAAPLPVARAAPTSGVAVLIGTPADNPLVAAALKDGLVNVGPNNPGPRGYEIRIAPDGRRVVLAGADPLGTLYACVTFGELLTARGGGAAWRAAEVRDWPDIIHVTMGGDFVGSAFTPELKDLFAALRHDPDPAPALRERYLAAVRAQHDWMLRRKITSMTYALAHLQGRRMTPRPNDGGAVIREGIAYGKDRGIGALVYAASPFVGRTNFFAPPPDQALPPGRYPEWIRGWSLDDARRETAENLAVLMNHYGVTDLGLHDTDAGGVGNPAQWNDRPANDRARWGDDYAAATVHIHRQYYDAFKKLAPGVRLHFTLYPYVVEVLDEDSGEWYLRQPWSGSATGPDVRERSRANKARYEVFWKRMHAEMPPDVTFCVRETFAAPTAAFREITRGRPAFTFFGLQAKTFLAESCRWTGMFFREHDDFIFTTFADTFVPFNSLAVREYAWNAATPGAAPFAEHAPTSELYSLVLPRLVRNLFGRRAAPAVVAAVAEPLTPSALTTLKDAAALEAQAAMAARGAQSLDAAWAQTRGGADRLGMDDYAFRRFVNLREIFHTCAWTAGVRAGVARARERAADRDGPAAHDALANAAAQLDAARAGRERLLAERPDDSVLRQKDANRWSAGWRAGMADQLDLEALEADLRRARADLDSADSNRAPAGLVQAPNAAQALTGSVTVLSLEIGPVTLRDRIATEARLALEIAVNRELREVEVRAEAYDGADRPQGERVLARIDRVVSRWRTPEPLRLLLPDDCAKGRLRIRVSGNAGGFECWVRFGDGSSAR